MRTCQCCALAMLSLVVFVFWVRFFCCCCLFFETSLSVLRFQKEHSSPGAPPALSGLYTSLACSAPGWTCRAVLVTEHIFCHLSVLLYLISHFFFFSWNEALFIPEQFNTHLKSELKLLEFLLLCAGVARIVISLILEGPQVPN